MKLNTYECMFLLDTNKVSGDMDGAARQLHAILEKHHAEVLASRPWDERRLAYPIKGHKKGLYYLTYFRTEGKNLAPIERDFALNEMILRQLVIRIEPKLEETMLAVARDEHAYALQAGNADADTDLPGGGGRSEERRGGFRGGRRPEPAEQT